MALASAALDYVRRAGAGLVRGVNSPGPAVDVGDLTPDSVSTGAGLMQLATSIAAGFRARANYKQQREADAQRGRYLDAQTRIMEAKLSAPSPQTYTLTTPTRTEHALPPGHEGPVGDTTGGEQITFDDPREYSQELDRWYPAPAAEKQPAPMTDYQREGLDIRRRLASVAERHATARESGAGAAGASRSRIGALNASVRQLEGESEAGGAQAADNAGRIAEGLVQTLRGARVNEKGVVEKIPREMRLKAAIELGVPITANSAEIQAAAKAWTAKRGGRWAESTRGRSRERIARANQAIYDEAGLDFGDDAAAMIEAIRSLSDDE